MKPLVFTSLAFALLFTATAALACSAMGPNTHVGQIISLDRTAGTLTSPSPSSSRTSCCSRRPVPGAR